jgi:hypothetical protein
MRPEEMGKGQLWREPHFVKWTGLSQDELDDEHGRKSKKEGVFQARPLGRAQRAEGTSRNGDAGWGAGH